MLLGLAFAINWGLWLCLTAYGIYFVITTFLEDGAGTGLVSIIVVGIILSITFFIGGMITAPIGLLGSRLVGTSKGGGIKWKPS